MALNQIAVGIQNNPDTTAAITARGGKQGETMVSELHGRYYEQAYRGNLVQGAVAAQVTTVGLAATYTGLILSNPIGSNVNLAVNKCGFAFTVAFGAVAAIGLMAGYNGSTNVTHTTPVTPRNLFFNNSSIGKGLLDSSAVMPTAPTLYTVFGSATTATAAVPPLPSGYYDLEGSLVVPAGGYVAFYTSSASGAAGGYFSFQWEEVPI
jgi:hypothetical protein